LEFDVKTSIVRTIALAAVVLVAACSGGIAGRSLLPQAGPQSVSFGNLSVEELAVLEAPRELACPPAAAPGYETCFAIMGAYALDPRLSPNASCLHLPGCYVASDLQSAYGVTAAAKSAGRGMTVAAVDAYGYPQARKDLALYRKFVGLPPCGPGCLRIVNQTGGRKLPKPGAGSNWSWQGEQALDIDMISAICPNCKIVLVQTNSASSADLIAGEQTALKMATIISNSWGGPEQIATFPVFDTHPGKVITASAGDGGAGGAKSPGYRAAPEMQPCGFAGVVCVGGTSLVLNNGVRVSEVVWEDFHVKIKNKFYDLGATGSGCSAIVPKPSWQTDKGCTKRSASDVSANADPLTGVVTACTPCAQHYGFSSSLLGGWGGTSESSPLIAAMYALAGNASALADPSATLWSKIGTSALNDITKGYNDKKGVTGLVCTAAIKYICTAGPGYDGPSGVGTPNGLGAL
jgi:subtilase family serine protease